MKAPMRFIVILGPGAEGKMTVGQALAALTGLKLLHNHMTIELVREFFHPHGSPEGRRLNALFRQEIFEAVARSDLPGLVFTYMFEFDDPEEHRYIGGLLDLFRRHGAETGVVELYADYDTRLGRNRTENRLAHKPSKRDLAFSNELILREENYRLNTRAGETPFEPYLKIDNTQLTPHETALKIMEAFLIPELESTTP